MKRRNLLTAVAVLPMIRILPSKRQLVAPAQLLRTHQWRALQSWGNPWARPGFLCEAVYTSIVAASVEALSQTDIFFAQES